MDISGIKVNNQTADYSQGVVQKDEKHENAVSIKKEEPVEKKQVQVTQEKLEAALDVANKVLFKNNTHLKFEIHEKTKEVMVKIINDESGEIVKEIPPEKMLDMVAKLWEIAGILIDERR